MTNGSILYTLYYVLITLKTNKICLACMAKQCLINDLHKHMFAIYCVLYGAHMYYTA